MQLIIGMRGFGKIDDCANPLLEFPFIEFMFTPRLSRLFVLPAHVYIHAEPEWTFIPK